MLQLLLLDFPSTMESIAAAFHWLPRILVITHFTHERSCSNAHTPTDLLWALQLAPIGAVTAGQGAVLEGEPVAGYISYMQCSCVSTALQHLHVSEAPIRL